MKVLTLNCGSSSLKYRLIAMPAESELVAGEAQRIGFRTAEPARIVCRRGAAETVHSVPMANHAEAFAWIINSLAQDAALQPDAIGHRVVHGGAIFTDPVLVDTNVIRQLAAIRQLAPLHNPAAIALIEECRRRCRSLPQVAVFDTAFHATIPEYARTYALPEALRVGLGIRKYGFHGISHQYVAEEAARWLGRELQDFNAVSCHLGSGGASLCALRGGQSVDNTMGYCPLQGLVMSTRCGDLDPAAALRLMIEAYDGQAAQLELMLNQASGILGLSGLSGDIRDVLSAAAAGHPDAPRLAEIALMYLWRIRKYLGAYLAVVGQCHAVIFTDTIGESIPSVRRSVCADLDVFGLELDTARNNNLSVLPADIASASSRVRILVLHTNEELAIARRTYQTISRQLPPPIPKAS